jgi:carbamoyl-phosphate synthase large subunit
MAICDSTQDIRAYLRRERPEGVILVDRFLEGAIEFDVDALCDGSACWIAAVMEHVEAAGIHSGDSACVLPPQQVAPELIAELEAQTAAIATALGVVGLINVQYGLCDGKLYVIEANPRASRTIPFVAKATGVPLVGLALRIMLGEPIADLGLPRARTAKYVAVKEAVLPFSRFTGSDPLLGPEMRATGEVMGLAPTFGAAFAKAQRGAGVPLPRSGTVFVSTRDADKPRAVMLAGQLAAHGLSICATRGTAASLAVAGVPVEAVRKVSEGPDNITDAILAGEIAMVINTPSGGGDRTDGAAIRHAAIRAGIPCITTIEAAEAAATALGTDDVTPVALQDIDSSPRAG